MQSEVVDIKSDYAYKELYIEAYNFYNKYLLNIEILYNDNLIKVYFPKLPHCDAFTQELRLKFTNNADRKNINTKI